MIVQEPLICLYFKRGIPQIFKSYSSTNKVIWKYIQKSELMWKWSIIEMCAYLDFYTVMVIETKGLDVYNTNQCN